MKIYILYLVPIFCFLLRLNCQAEEVISENCSTKRAIPVATLLSKEDLICNGSAGDSIVGAYLKSSLPKNALITTEHVTKIKPVQMISISNPFRPVEILVQKQDLPKDQGVYFNFDNSPKYKLSPKDNVEFQAGDCISILTSEPLQNRSDLYKLVVLTSGVDDQSRKRELDEFKKFKNAHFTLKKVDSQCWRDIVNSYRKQFK